MSIEGLTLVSLIVAFGFGVLSFVSPCVLPLLPGYLSLMSGYSVSDLQEGKGSTLRMLRVTGLFVLGFTVVFIAWGAAATTLGQFLRQNLRTAGVIAGWVVVVFGIVIVASAVLNLPWLQNMMRERKMEVRPSRLGNWAPPVMGFAFGFAWTPCIGPVLGSILALAAAQETVTEGILLLFAYSMGLGIPFIASGLAMTRLIGAMAFLRKHLRSINTLSGLTLIWFGWLMISNRLFELSNWFVDILERLGLDFLTAI